MTENLGKEAPIKRFVDYLTTKIHEMPTGEERELLTDLNIWIQTQEQALIEAKQFGEEMEKLSDTFFEELEQYIESHTGERHCCECRTNPPKGGMVCSGCYKLRMMTETHCCRPNRIIKDKCRQFVKKIEVSVGERK